MDEPRSIAVLRAALLRLGLSEDEVERFLRKLGSDLAKGTADEETIRRICEEFVAPLTQADERFGNRSILSWRMAKIIGGGVSLGVLADLVSDLIKSGLCEPTPVQISISQEVAFRPEGSPVKVIPNGEATGNVGPTCVVRGLRPVRRRLHMTVTRASTVCSVSRTTYATAERCEPVPLATAERIKASLFVFGQSCGVRIGYLERRPLNGYPDEIYLFCL